MGELNLSFGHHHLYPLCIRQELCQRERRGRMRQCAYRVNQLGIQNHARGSYLFIHLFIYSCIYLFDYSLIPAQTGYRIIYTVISVSCQLIFKGIGQFFYSSNYHFIALFIYSFIYLFIYKSIYQLIYFFIPLFLYFSISLFFNFFISLFLYFFISLSIYLFMNLFLYYLYIYLFNSSPNRK